jgi:hypothetical protein
MVMMRNGMKMETIGPVQLSTGKGVQKIILLAVSTSLWVDSVTLG